MAVRVVKTETGMLLGCRVLGKEVQGRSRVVFAGPTSTAHAMFLQGAYTRGDAYKFSTVYDTCIPVARRRLCAWRRTPAMQA